MVTHDIPAIVVAGAALRPQGCQTATAGPTAGISAGPAPRP